MLNSIVTVKKNKTKQRTWKLEDCFVSIASVGIFLDSSHSLPCNPLTSCLTGEHWLCLIMRNNPSQNKILSDLREMIHQKVNKKK